MWQRPRPNPLANPMSLWHETWQQQQGQKLSKIAFFTSSISIRGWISLRGTKTPDLRFSRFPNTHTAADHLLVPACVWALAASRASACRLLEHFLLLWPRVQVPQSHHHPPSPPLFHSSNPTATCWFCVKYTCKNQTNFALYWVWGPPVGSRFPFPFFGPLCFIVFVWPYLPLPLAQPLRQTRLLRNWSKKSIIDFCVMPVALKFPVISNLIFCQSRY